MIALIALPVLVIYVAVLGAAMTIMRADARAEVEAATTRLAANYAARFDGAFREARAVADSTARFFETAPELTEEQIYAQLRANVLQNPLVFGAAAAFEPGTLRDDDSLVCPYAYRGPGGIAEMNITREVYDWYGDERWQWWHQAKRAGRGIWTDPFFDEGAGNVVMVTYSAPFFLDGRFRGVTTVDIRLPTLEESIGRQITSDTPFMILTADGRFVASRAESQVMARTIFEVAADAGRPDVAAAATDIVSGKTGVTALQGWDAVPRGWEGWNETQWVFYAPIESTGWAFAALVPERQALAGVQRRAIQGALALGVTLLLIIGCIWLVSRRITRPIERLRSKVLQIAGGDLSARVDGIQSADEIGDLAASFNRMTDDLKTHVAELAHARAASRDAVIFAMAKLAESRDDDTGKHLERICRYVEILAKRLAESRPEIDPEWVRTVTLTAALHDIGKVGIPDAVLCKPGKLSDEERKVIQKHATIGGDTLLAVKRHMTQDTFLVTATEIAFAHHERWDGSGYPFGLAREDISLAARIVAVADVYDALTSERVYKKAMAHEDAAAAIVKGSGSHFDPAVVEAFKVTQNAIRATAEELRHRSDDGEAGRSR